VLDEAEEIAMRTKRLLAALMNSKRKAQARQRAEKHSIARVSESLEK
jgi:hypothetical protein